MAIIGFQPKDKNSFRIGGTTGSFVIMEGKQQYIVVIAVFAMIMRGFDYVFSLLCNLFLVEGVYEGYK